MATTHGLYAQAVESNKNSAITKDISGICFHCGTPRHFKPNCPFKSQKLVCCKCNGDHHTQTCTAQDQHPILSKINIDIIKNSDNIIYFPPVKIFLSSPTSPNIVYEYLFLKCI